MAWPRSVVIMRYVGPLCWFNGVWTGHDGAAGRPTDSGVCDGLVFIWFSLFFVINLKNNTKNLLQVASRGCSCLNWDKWIHAATFPSSRNNNESLLFHGSWGEGGWVSFVVEGGVASKPRPLTPLRGGEGLGLRVHRGCQGNKEITTITAIQRCEPAKESLSIRHSWGSYRRVNPPLSQSSDVTLLLKLS